MSKCQQLQRIPKQCGCGSQELSANNLNSRQCDQSYDHRRFQIDFPARRLQQLGIERLHALFDIDGERFCRLRSPVSNLGLLKGKKLPIPVFIEYEYLGLGTPQEEVRKCLTYVKSALA